MTCFLLRRIHWFEKKLIDFPITIRDQPPQQLEWLTIGHLELRPLKYNFASTGDLKRLPIYGVCKQVTLPETNSSPLNIGFPSQPSSGAMLVSGSVLMDTHGYSMLLHL